MKRTAIRFLYALAATSGFLLLLSTITLIAVAAKLLEELHPYAPWGLYCIVVMLMAAMTLTLRALFSNPRKPELPGHDASQVTTEWTAYMVTRMPVHPMHPDAKAKTKDLRWLRTNIKFMEVDTLHATKEAATKNFFIGAFAQNTSYGTTTTLLNVLRLVRRIYTMYHKDSHPLEFIQLVRSVYDCLPLSDFRKDELPAHIKPIIQSSFSNTLSSLLPAGNLLTPFFLNLFLSGSTNAYLTCLAGIITMRHSQAMTKEEQDEIVQRSMFEASFMLKEIVRECNPVLSVTISEAVKKAGIESLDTVQTPTVGSGFAQDIVSHIATSIKHIIRENVETEKGAS